MDNCSQCHKDKKIILCPYTGHRICESCMLDNEREFLEAQKFGSMLGD